MTFGHARACNVVHRDCSCWYPPLTSLDLGSRTSHQGAAVAVTSDPITWSAPTMTVSQCLTKRPCDARPQHRQTEEQWTAWHKTACCRCRSNTGDGGSIQVHYVLKSVLKQCMSCMKPYCFFRRSTSPCLVQEVKYFYQFHNLQIVTLPNSLLWANSWDGFARVLIRTLDYRKMLRRCFVNLIHLI